MQKTQETKVQFLGQENPLEKGMATHSSILAGGIHGERSLVDYSQTRLSTQARVHVMCQTDLFLLGRMKFMVKEVTSSLKHLFFP